MKIIGFVNINGRTEMVMKGDSAMLVNRKPFFIPDGTNDIGYTDCIVYRISRLGKNIAPTFANRYWDAWTFGLDFCARDWLQAAIEREGSWTEAMAFDNSLAIGLFGLKGGEAERQRGGEAERQRGGEAEGQRGGEAERLNDEMVISIEEAIHRASRTMTIRQGDYIYIQLKQPFTPVQRDEVITRTIDNNEILYCKIK